MIIAGVYVLMFRQSDEGKVRALAAAVHAAPSENAIFRAERIQDTLARLVLADVQIDVPGVREGLEPRSNLVAFAIGAGIQYGTVEVRFDAVSVELEKPQRRAWVTSTASASGGNRGESPRGVLRFVESGGERRITFVAIAGADQR